MRLSSAGIRDLRVVCRYYQREPESEDEFVKTNRDIPKTSLGSCSLDYLLGGYH